MWILTELMPSFPTFPYNRGVLFHFHYRDAMAFGYTHETIIWWLTSFSTFFPSSSIFIWKFFHASINSLCITIALLFMFACLEKAPSGKIFEAFFTANWKLIFTSHPSASNLTAESVDRENSSFALPTGRRYALLSPQMFIVSRVETSKI